MKAWLKRLGLVFTTGLVLLITVFASATGCGRSMGGRLAGERLLRAEKSPNFAHGKFVNHPPASKLAQGRKIDSIVRYFTVDSVRTAPGPLPIVKRGAKDFADPPSAGLEAIWIGHSTSILDIEGQRVMIDPMLSDRASPVSWAGPRRYHEAPMGIADLPRVDVAVVSHDHYDHLDMATVEALARGGTVFVVPLGIGAHLEAWDVPAKQIVELDWWDSYAIGGLTKRAGMPDNRIRGCLIEACGDA